MTNLTHTQDISNSRIYGSLSAINLSGQDSFGEELYYYDLNAFGDVSLQLVTDIYTGNYRGGNPYPNTDTADPNDYYKNGSRPNNLTEANGKLTYCICGNSNPTNRKLWVYDSNDIVSTDDSTDNPPRIIETIYPVQNSNIATNDSVIQDRIDRFDDDVSDSFIIPLGGKIYFTSFRGSLTEDTFEQILYEYNPTNRELTEKINLTDEVGYEQIMFLTEINGKLYFIGRERNGIINDFICVYDPEKPYTVGRTNPVFINLYDGNIENIRFTTFNKIEDKIITV